MAYRDYQPGQTRLGPNMILSDARRCQRARNRRIYLEIEEFRHELKAGLGLSDHGT